MTDQQPMRAPEQARCPSCNGGSPKEATRCMWCGASLAPVTTPEGFSLPTPQQPAQVVVMQRPPRSRTTAIVLALFLGGLGAHKFYLGRPGQGIVYALFCWTFIPSIVAFIEMFVYLGMKDDAFAKAFP